MMKIVLINAVTLLRIPLSLLYCMMILFYDHPFLPCILLFMAIGASDYFDGKLARKYHAQTDTGAKLDVASDFFFIMTACLSWIDLGLFPGWMLGVILLKFLEFLITSSINKRKSQSAAIFKFDPLGRIAAVAFYLLPVVVLLLVYYFSESWYEPMLKLICIGITVMAVWSSVLRIIFLVRTSKDPLE